MPGGPGDNLLHYRLIDEQGNFSHTFEGNLTRLVVTAGIGREVYRIDADEVPEADEADRGVLYSPRVMDTQMDTCSGGCHRSG